MPELNRFVLADFLHENFPVDGPNLTRRQALKVTAATVAATAGLSLKPSPAEAAIPAIAVGAFRVAVAWAVGKALDYLWDEYVAAKPRIVPTTFRPTAARNSFHNGHASRLAIAGFSTGEKRRGNLTVKVNRHIYASPRNRHCNAGLGGHDLNGPELIGLRSHYQNECYRSIPFPTSLRQRPTDSDAAILGRLIRDAGAHTCGLQLHYTRSFAVVNKRSLVTAYCISSKYNSKAAAQVVFAS